MQLVISVWVVTQSFLPTSIPGGGINDDPKRGYKVMIPGRSVDLLVQLKNRSFKNAFRFLASQKSL